MGRRSVPLAAALLAAEVVLYASFAGGDPRLEKLYGTFIAPCCWRENLLVHASTEADALRTRIQSEVKAGHSDQQIKDKLVLDYSGRILGTPEGVPGELLSWMPWLVLTAGALLVSTIIWRSVRNGSKSEAREA